jgi:hypothetical protein
VPPVDPPLEPEEPLDALSVFPPPLEPDEVEELAAGEDREGVDRVPAERVFVLFSEQPQPCGRRVSEQLFAASAV